jgi:hypothetical protein
VALRGARGTERDLPDLGLPASAGLVEHLDELGLGFDRHEQIGFWLPPARTSRPRRPRCQSGRVHQGDPQLRGLDIEIPSAVIDGPVAVVEQAADDVDRLAEGSDVFESVVELCEKLDETPPR